MKSEALSLLHLFLSPFVSPQTGLFLLTKKVNVTAQGAVGADVYEICVLLVRFCACL